MSKHTILSFRSLKPVALLMATFGLCPLSFYVQLFSSTGIIKNLPESSSWISRTYGLVLGSILTSFNLLNFIEIFFAPKELFPQMVFFYSMLSVLFVFLAYTALTYTQSCSSKYSSTRRLLLKLEETDRILMKQINRICELNINGRGAVEYRDEAGIVKLKILAVIASGLVMYVMDICSFYQIHLRQLLARLFSHLALTVVMIEFGVVVNLLRDRFSAVNSLLEETLRRQDIPEASGTSVHAWIRSDDIHKPNHQKRPLRNHLRVENIITLRIVHYRLQGIAKWNVAAAFRANLLAEVVQIFVSMILSAHTIVNNPYGTTFAISLGIWFLYTVLRITMVAVVCDGLTAEARRTTKILARPVLLEDQVGEEEEALFRQIVLFSRQIADCGPLRFRVLGGIFVVEGQILVAIFGTTLTYLVVLQQLK